MNSNLIIREAKIQDAKRLVEIYAPYVKDTAVSFEYKVPTLEEFEERIRHITEKYPYIVCLKDDKIVGYAYASTYSSREAYNWTAVSSIYVDKEFRRQGAGSLLYKELEERLNFELNTIKDMGYIEYFLIVWDLLRFGRSRGYYMGMGRGSAAGSLVSYALDITGIDPVKNNLLFIW